MQNAGFSIQAESAFWTPMRRCFVVLCLSLAAVTTAPDVRAQSGGFEVASVKPSNPNPTGPLGAAPMVLPALGRLTAMNATLRMLVMAAYQKQPFEIVGGPPWQNSDKFDINARAENASLTTDQMLDLLKTLLADRFKLKVHTETREVPIYALVVARGDGKTGQKLTPSADTCPDIKVQQQQQLEALAKGGLSALAAMAGKPGESTPCSISPIPQSTPGAIGMKVRGQAISTLALLLTQLTGRPVADKTGLTGLYDFELTIDLRTLLNLYQELGINVGPLPPTLPEGPSLMTLLQEDLGLKLDSQRGPGDVLVIDGAELPTPD
jgi:uncharacterized protein (TIGR03435 family)